eukprot:scaffold246639_cov16-Prasinocladus_malaysianus.AAC.1
MARDQVSSPSGCCLCAHDGPRLHCVRLRVDGRGLLQVASTRCLRHGRQQPPPKSQQQHQLHR